MDKKDKLENEETNTVGGKFANTDNHVPKEIRDTYFGDVKERSSKNKR